MVTSSCLGKAVGARTAPASCQGRSSTRSMQTLQHGACTNSRTWTHIGSKGKVRDVAASAAASAGEDSERRMFGSMPIPPIILSAFVGHSKPNTQQSSATKSGEHATEQPMSMRADATVTSSSQMPKTVMAANIRAPTGSMTTGTAGGGGGGGAAGGPPGSDGNPGGMISVADLDNMLADLKQSLHSIQTSRAEYVELLSHRDATIVELSQQLEEKDRHIHQLEAQVRAMQVQLDASRQRTPPPPQPVARNTAPGIPVVIPSTPPPRPTPTPQAVRASSHAPPAPTPPRSVPPTPEVVILYRTGWKQAYLHCNLDGKGWTVSPGIPMESVGNDMKQVRVPCSKLEFVVNNGKGDWDSPPGNYHINSPGSYRLEFGKVHKT